MKRAIFDGEHDLFRSSVRGFIERESKPYHDRWASEGLVSRTAWQEAGAQDLLCMSAPQEYGGAGVEDFRYPAILAKELQRANCTGPGFGIHSNIVAPYIIRYGRTGRTTRGIRSRRLKQQRTSRPESASMQATRLPDRLIQGKPPRVRVAEQPLAPPRR